MKAREQGGVVDERLNVYGVQSLKIAGNFYFILLFPGKKSPTLNLFSFRLQYRTRQCRS